MKQQLKIATILLTILLMLSCQSSKTKFYDCYSENNTSLLTKLQKNFEDQLETKYQKGNYLSNLIDYLEQIQNGKSAELIEPPSQYHQELLQSGIIDDIWTQKSINSNSKFIECLDKGENQLTKEYLNDIIHIGDISIIVLSKGAIQLINTNQSIDRELKLIFLVNFYLIWMND